MAGDASFNKVKKRLAVWLATQEVTLVEAEFQAQPKMPVDLFHLKQRPTAPDRDSFLAC